MKVRRGKVRQGNARVLLSPARHPSIAVFPIMLIAFMNCDNTDLQHPGLSVGFSCTPMSAIKPSCITKGSTLHINSAT